MTNRVKSFTKSSVRISHILKTQIFGPAKFSAMPPCSISIKIAYQHKGLSKFPQQMKGVSLYCLLVSMALLHVCCGGSVRQSSNGVPLSLHQLQSSWFFTRTDARSIPSASKPLKPTSNSRSLDVLLSTRPVRHSLLYSFQPHSSLVMSRPYKSPIWDGVVSTVLILGVLSVVSDLPYLIRGRDPCEFCLAQLG